MIATGSCGLERNVSKAVRYLEFAARSEHIESMYELGDIYYWGIGIEKNREKAEYWYTLAAEVGYAEAQYALGYIFSQKMISNKKSNGFGMLQSRVIFPVK